MKNEIIGKRERTRTFNLQFWRLLPYLLGYSLILELSIRFELMWTRSLRLTKPLQSTTMGTQHFMVGNVGLEPLFLTPNQVCYHYTTFPKLSTTNKEDLLNLLAGAMAYHVCQPLINNFYSRARWLVRTILYRKPISKTPKTLSF